MRDGYLKDYISGEEIKATPEEVEAVQVFSEILVEDYSYPKEQLQTRPQWRVKVRPSDTKKEYPIDIGVFTFRVVYKIERDQVLVQVVNINAYDYRKK